MLLLMRVGVPSQSKHIDRLLDEAQRGKKWIRELFRVNTQAIVIKR
jgi:hypothetical protein